MPMNPPLSGVDLATMLYLNPELVAYSNLTSLPLARGAWESGAGASFSALPNVIPTPPSGFDPKVYLAAQKDVSGMNRTIRDAMRGIGLSEKAVGRRGTFVSTLMIDVVLMATTDSGGLKFQLTPEDVANLPASFTSQNLNPGDRVSLQRRAAGSGTYGDISYGTVVSVGSATECTIAPDAPAAFLTAFPGSTQFTLLGIRIWDAERQALVAFARNAAAMSNALTLASSPTPPFPETETLDESGSNATISHLPGYVDPYDIVPRADFSLGAYRAVYPEVKALDFSDTYLDYRMRWRRTDEYRIIKGRDIFNLEAPYANGLLQGGGGGGNGLGLAGFNALFNNNVTVSNALSVGGRVGIGMPCTGHEGCSGEVDVWEASAAAAATESELPPWAMVLGSNTRLAVDGDIFATGTVISLSDARAKVEVRPIEDALAKVARLNGYTYEVPLTASSRRHTGLLAQEVADVLPEAVFYRPPGSAGERAAAMGTTPIASIAYGNLAGLFVSAINELSARLERLERL